MKWTEAVEAIRKHEPEMRENFRQMAELDRRMRERGICVNKWPPILVAAAEALGISVGDQ
jgi:hypothetical protein